MYKSLLAGLLALTLAGPAHPDGGVYDLSEEEGLYTPIADVPLHLASDTTQLSRLYARQPVMVALVFTRCTGICSPFLLRLAEDMRALDPREKFKVLVVSFDPRDTQADMDGYARLFQLGGDDRWLFATTPQIEALTSSVGFRPTWDSLSGQFDHEALLVGVNGNGYIIRKMAGIRERKDIASLIKTLTGEFIPSYPLPGEDRLLSCFTYDPVTGVRKPSYGLLILLVPAAITFILMLWMGLASRKWRLKKS
ncbi:MAG: SCO family protein [Flavobacteriales bacterium]|nr:SCO family protein [Flavobacteriales bacterium]MEB2342605.1 SCO family protein [Flavobacteriia bacterium]